jgi:hypothetical protein
MARLRSDQVCGQFGQPLKGLLSELSGADTPELSRQIIRIVRIVLASNDWKRTDDFAWFTQSLDRYYRARLATFGSDGSSWGIEAACRMTLSRLKGPSTRAGSVHFLLELEWLAISHRGAPACCLRQGSPAACHWPGAPANPPAFRPRQERRYSTQTIAGRPGRRCPPKSRGDLSAPSRWDPVVPPVSYRAYDVARNLAAHSRPSAPMQTAGARPWRTG